MKSGIFNSCRRRAGTAAAVAALLALGRFSATAQPFASPVGPTWDCLISGSGQQGIAFLTFSNDFTFSGFQLLVGKQSASSASTSTTAVDQRNSGGADQRSTETSVNPVGGGTNLFGFGPVSGPWRFDAKGRVLGFFTEVLNQQTLITTNIVMTVSNQTFLDTNTIPPTEVTINTTNFSTTYVTNTTATTNAVSFTAKVVSVKHLSLVSSTPYGKVSYNGVPQDLKPIPAPIAGTWFGAKKQNKQTFIEFFNLGPTGVRNIYSTTNGTGPGFKFGGVSMVSVQKKMGFAFSTFQGLGTDIPIDAEGNISGGVLSATFGGISYPRIGAKANTKGFEEPIVPINFQAQRQGP